MDNRLLVSSSRDRVAVTSVPQLQGVVESVDYDGGTVTVTPGSFAGMPMVMAMTFGARPLHPHDRIEALVGARPKIWSLYRIRVVGTTPRARA
jgi:hypothetical protein